MHYTTYFKVSLLCLIVSVVVIGLDARFHTFGILDKNKIEDSNTFLIGFACFLFCAFWIVVIPLAIATYICLLFFKMLKSLDAKHRGQEAVRKKKTRDDLEEEIIEIIETQIVLKEKLLEIANIQRWEKVMKSSRMISPKTVEQRECINDCCNLENCKK